MENSQPPPAQAGGEDAERSPPASPSTTTTTTTHSLLSPRYSHKSAAAAGDEADPPQVGVLACSSLALTSASDEARSREALKEGSLVWRQSRKDCQRVVLSLTPSILWIKKAHRNDFVPFLEVINIENVFMKKVSSSGPHHVAPGAELWRFLRKERPSM